jgi:hypothetical protein
LSEASTASLEKERLRNEYQFMLIGISNMIETIIAKAFIPEYVFIALIYYVFMMPTLNPQPSTVNPQPSIINPQPSTLNHQSSILNRQPSTLKTIL